MPDSQGTHQGPQITDEAMRAFIETAAGVDGTAPIWCPGCSAHEIVAHVAAAAQERANVIEEHAAGRPGRPTRSWEEREAPFRALPHALRSPSENAETIDDILGRLCA
jgi:hypothetical protein